MSDSFSVTFTLAKAANTHNTPTCYRLRAAAASAAASSSCFSQTIFSLSTLREPVDELLPMVIELARKLAHS